MTPDSQSAQGGLARAAAGCVRRGAGHPRKGLVFLPDMTIDGNLGMPFLKDWIVTLDLAEGRMRLQTAPV